MLKEDAKIEFVSDDDTSDIKTIIWRNAELAVLEDSSEKRENSSPKTDEGSEKTEESTQKQKKVHPKRTRVRRKQIKVPKKRSVMKV